MIIVMFTPYTKHHFVFGKSGKHLECAELLQKLIKYSVSLIVVNA